MHFVYILLGRGQRLYVGSTNNVQRRLAEHNSGNVRSTKAYIPYTLIATEKFAAKADERKRET